MSSQAESVSTPVEETDNDVEVETVASSIVDDSEEPLAEAVVVVEASEEDDTCEAVSVVVEGDAPSPPVKKRRTSSKKMPKKKDYRTQDLCIPFRTIKKAMKADPDTPIVQNEAAIMITVAAECFLSRLARNAYHREQRMLVYQDVAQARARDASMAFLETLLP